MPSIIKTGEWIASHVPVDEQVLDMTDWSLYFSGRDGYTFADVYSAPADPARAGSSYVTASSMVPGPIARYYAT